MKKTNSEKNIQLARQYDELTNLIKVLQEQRENCKSAIKNLMENDDTLQFGNSFLAVTRERTITKWDELKMKKNGIEPDDYKIKEKRREFGGLKRFAS